MVTGSMVTGFHYRVMRGTPQLISQLSTPDLTTIVVSAEKGLTHTTLDGPVPEEVRRSHVHEVPNCRVGQNKITDRFIAINRSCSQPDPRTNHVQQGSRTGNVDSRTELMS